MSDDLIQYLTAEDLESMGWNTHSGWYWYHPRCDDLCGVVWSGGIHLKYGGVSVCERATRGRLRHMLSALDIKS
jgi:hypothetical protein